MNANRRGTNRKQENGNGFEWNGNEKRTQTEQSAIHERNETKNTVVTTVRGNEMKKHLMCKQRKI